MAPFKTIAYLSIISALNIVHSNAQDYTFILNDIVEAVYQEAGYNEKDYVQRWLAEGNAIYRALGHIYSKFTDTSVFGEEEERIEFIVGSTGGNTCTYIYGEAERLEIINLQKHEKPSKIIVVYTLNYVNSAIAAQEYKDFKVALQRLINAGAKHTPPIEVDVRQFHPVLEDESTLVEEFDYQDFGKTVMDPDQKAAQEAIIFALHGQVNESVFVSSVGFTHLLENINIKKIVDCIVGSGSKAVSKDNQLLTAIPRAQIRIMAKAISLLYDDGGIFVIANDNPSGMNEDGVWTIDPSLRYPVDVILSCVWHKDLVNSEHFVHPSPTAVVLDITYNKTRLIDTLWELISEAPSTYWAIKADVLLATHSKAGVFAFTEVDVPTHMCIV